MVQSQFLSNFAGDDTALVAVMTEAEAVAAEREIITTGNRLRALLVEFYERRGWEALGHGSWRAWAAARLGEHERTAYKELTAGLVERELLPNWAKGEAGTLPESHLRPLAPLRDDPPALRETWERANEIAAEQGRPRTAAHVAQAVRERTAAEEMDAEPLSPYEAQIVPPPRPAAPPPMAVHFSSDTPEWYTPAHIIERVHALFGGIDLDPCSNSTDPARANVPARVYYDQAMDGLAQSWRLPPHADDYGEMSYAVRVYMNPPYGDEIEAWVDRLVSAYESGEITEGVALVPARIGAKWFQKLRAYPWCGVHGRLRFVGADSSAPFPSALVYLGRDIDGFHDMFGDIGIIYQERRRAA